MLGQPKSMKVKDVIKMIEQDGWFMIRRKGIHRQYKHDYKKGLMTVAGRLSDDLAKGTLQSVFKQVQSGSARLCCHRRNY